MCPVRLTQTEKGVRHVKQTMNQKLAALQQMGVTQLRAKYLEVFGEPTRTGNKAFLFKKLGWGC